MCDQITMREEGRWEVGREEGQRGRVSGGGMFEGEGLCVSYTPHLLGLKAYTSLKLSIDTAGVKTSNRPIT